MFTTENSNLTAKTYPRYTRKEEADLCRLSQHGDLQARRLLVESCIPWAVRIAKDFATPGEDPDDLMQEAMLALSESVLTFDASYRFTTYCKRAVMWRLLTHRLNSRNTIRRPEKRSHRYGDQWDRADRRNFGELTHSLAVHDSDYTEETQQENIDHLLSHVDRLPQREREVVRMRLAGSPYREIAKRWSVSQQRVREVYLRAERLLRAELAPTLS